MDKVQQLDTALEQSTERRGRFTVVVLGLGYVGLPLAIAAEQKGYRLIGFDIDKKRVEALAKREANYLSPSESRLFAKSTMQITDDEARIHEADIAIVCVPTPVNENHTPDLRPLRNACFIVGRNLKRDALVIVESTVNPGACETVALPVIETVSGLEVGKDFFFSHCPERVNPGDSYYSVGNIPRVVGAADQESADRTMAFYESITDAHVTLMGSIKEAEAVKMVENSFRDINIAFVNELAMSFGKAGIDIENVITGASTKPFAFMPHHPGCGVGGHCIPVDPYYLIRFGSENGFTHRLLMNAREINNGMPKYTVNLLARSLKEVGRKLRGSKVALLGLAYKRDIGDIRESPALAIRDELIERGVTVRSFDPFVPGASSAGSLEEALTGVDALVLATDHTAFRELEPATLLKSGVRIVIDGRNCLPKELFLEEGIAYRGIGR